MQYTYRNSIITSLLLEQIIDIEFISFIILEHSFHSNNSFSIGDT